MKRRYSLVTLVATMLGAALPVSAEASPLRISGLGLQSYHEVTVTVSTTPNEAARERTVQQDGGTPPPGSFAGLLTASPASPLAQTASVQQDKSEPIWQCIYEDEASQSLCVVGQPVWKSTPDFHFSTAGRADVVNAGLTLRASGEASYVESPKSVGTNDGVKVMTEAWSVFHLRLVDDPVVPGSGASVLNWSGHIDLAHDSLGGIDPTVEADVELVIVDSSGRRERRFDDGAFSFSERVSAGAEVWLGVGLHVFYSALGAGGGTTLMANWDAGVYSSALTIDGFVPVVISTAPGSTAGVVPEPATLLMLSVGLGMLVVRRRWRISPHAL